MFFIFVTRVPDMLRSYCVVTSCHQK